MARTTLIAKVSLYYFNPIFLVREAYYNNMGENDNADNEKDVVEGDQDQDESQNLDGADDEGADGADKSDDDNSDDGEGADKDDKSESKPTIKADEEPKTRKRNIDFIRERQQKKAEKQNNKGYEGNGDDEDEIDGDDAKIIDQRVQKILTPFIQKQMQDEDAQEIADFVKQNPDFAPYAGTVAKYAQHESRRNMPIKAIFYEVAGDDLLMIGAKRAQKAREKSKESGAGGGSGGSNDSAGKPVWEMTPEEFKAEQDKVRNTPRS